MRWQAASTHDASLSSTPRCRSFALPHFSKRSTLIFPTCTCNEATSCFHRTKKDIRVHCYFVTYNNGVVHPTVSRSKQNYDITMFHLLFSARDAQKIPRAAANPSIAAIAGPSTAVVAAAVVAQASGKLSTSWVSLGQKVITKQSSTALIIKLKRIIGTGWSQCKKSVVDVETHRSYCNSTNDFNSCISSVHRNRDKCLATVKELQYCAGHRYFSSCHIFRHVKVEPEAAHLNIGRFRVWTPHHQLPCSVFDAATSEAALCKATRVRSYLLHVICHWVGKDFVA